MNTEPFHETRAIILEGVVKAFQSTTEIAPALSSLSTSITRGKITGLVGPDGAGKTTLLRLIAGLLSLTQGRIVVEGLDPKTQLDALHQIIGYMPQKFGLYDDLTVIENLVLYANLRGVMAEARHNAFEKLLQFTNLADFTTRPAGKLSGGMKQKLGLACALLGYPKVLLLDEPSVGVDPISRQELWQMVNELTSQGITVIWSTSYLDEAEGCHEVLLMNQGQLVYNGPPATLTTALIGRSVQVQQIQGNHRKVLQAALRTNEVMDGVIQGQNVRLVLKQKGVNPPLELLHAGSEAIIIPVKPRFEDAFIDLLGGGPGGESVLTNVMKPIKPTPITSVIEASKLTKQFGDFVATDNISFSVKRGEIFGLLGPNGAGKSTTFKMMCGLVAPTSGSAKVLGLDLQKRTTVARQQLGYMAQKFSLYNDLTVLQNLEFFSGIYGLYGIRQTQKIQEMVDSFDLKNYLKTRTVELPLGFKQRLALACAIMHEPAILFLDEPTSGVDPITRREFWTHINGLVEKGVTIMVTTHYMDEAEYCDKIGLVYKGLLIASGTPDELKQAVASEKKPEPTMEEAFIELVLKHDENKPTKPKESLKQSETLHKKSYAFAANHPKLRRWSALCLKEFYQIIRDPSSILIAFVLPLLMLFIFGFGVNLDSSRLRLGMVVEPFSVEAKRLEKTFQASPYIELILMKNTSIASQKLTQGDVRGLVILQSNFDEQLKKPEGLAPIQIITDGAETNTANFVKAYALGTVQIWQQRRNAETAQPSLTAINVENRYWFNSAAISRYFLIPGSIVLIMTVIGALLTSLVIAREWENGTMEALLSTPMTRLEFLGSKLVPYYVLGIIAMSVCTLTAVTLMGTPLRGSLLLLFITTTLFLGNSLGLGLLFSTLTRNQFNAAQAALNIAYLPALMLSGFVFEIHSMPIAVQAITYLFPARYFVSTLHSLFLAGNIGLLFLKNAFFLVAFALLFLGLTYKFTGQRLD